MNISRVEEVIFEIIIYLKNPNNKLKTAWVIKVLVKIHLQPLWKNSFEVQVSKGDVFQNKYNCTYAILGTTCVESETCYEKYHKKRMWSIHYWLHPKNS